MEHGKPNSNTDRLSACPSTTSVQILDQHIFHGDLHLEKKKNPKRVREQLLGGGGGMLRTDMVEWICRGQTPPVLPSLSPSCPPHLIPKTSNQQVQLTPCSSVLQDKEKKSADRDAFVSSYTAGTACIEGDLKKKLNI